jgi:PUA-domain protein
MKRTTLKSKDLNKLLPEFNVTISKKDHVQIIEDKYKIILINNQPSFFYYQDKILPTLKYLQSHAVLKIIVVDMGAVKFVINGADIMRPGITNINQSIDKNEFIVIVDENNHKPLAIGKALFSGQQMHDMTAGKVIQNIHYVGDELWGLY